jgi:ribosomal protein S20
MQRTVHEWLLDDSTAAQAMLHAVQHIFDMCVDAGVCKQTAVSNSRAHLHQTTNITV